MNSDSGTDSDRQDILLADTNTIHIKKLKTVKILGFHLWISCLITIDGIVLSDAATDEKRCLSYFSMLYMRVFFWILTLIIDQVLKYYHEKHRLHGYHEFIKKMNFLRSLPFYIVSMWNTTIFAVAVIMQHYYSENFGKHCVEKIFSPIVYITIFSLLESILLICVNGCYIRRIMKFNKDAQLPDALRGTHLERDSIALNMSVDVIQSELLEKQADLISYLKDHNYELNQKLMLLNAQMRHVTIHNLTNNI